MAESYARIIEYGTKQIPFVLKYSNRKTMGISVSPNKKVTVTVPFHSNYEQVIKKLENKASWISRQIRAFDSCQSPVFVSQKEYVSGEAWLYLGRKYRLKVICGSQELVKMSGRYIQVFVFDKENKARISSLLLAWYRNLAKRKFAERLEYLLHIIRREQIQVKQCFVRHMEKRWGSCTARGNIILNLSLIQASVQCIDYVIAHEICHLKHLNHGKQFQKMLIRYMPDFEKRRKKLENIALLTIPK